MDGAHPDSHCSIDLLDEPSARRRAGRPLVACEGCGFQWFGVIAADGLAVLGHCPHCEGTLRFDEGAKSIPNDVIDTLCEAAEVHPWRIGCGPPHSGR